MENFEKLYTLLFNGITDALEEMESRNYGKAEEILKAAQEDAEELYLGESGDDSPQEPECGSEKRS